ncbi:MAG TPA: hypothetical protein VF721_07780 [Pyrinomonadaceae bacterium]|jgi:uncharacterized protein (DUF4415 family)
MSKSKKDSSVFEFEVTPEDVEELRKDGIPESELPKVGIIQNSPRSGHFAASGEQEGKIPVYISAEILDFFSRRSSESLEEQINAALREVMENETSR